MEILKLGEYRAKCSVSFSEIKYWLQQPKLTQKRDHKVFCSFSIFFFLLCPISSLRDCRFSDDFKGNGS